MSAIFLRILLFLLPLALLVLIVKMVRKGRDDDGVIDPRTVRIILTVSITGMAVFILLLVYLNIGREDNRSLEYVPPQTIDGEIEPGHFEGPDPEEDSDQDEDR